MFYPLDWDIVRSLVLVSAYRYFAKWVAALEPYYHKQFLDSLEDQAVVYGLLLRLGIVRTFHAIQESSFFTKHISSGTIRDYLDVKISNFLYGEFNKRSISFFRETHGSTYAAVDPLTWRLDMMLKSDGFDANLNLSALHNPETVKQFTGEEFHIHSYEEKLRGSYKGNLDDDILVKNVYNYFYLVGRTLKLIGVLMCLSYYRQDAMSDDYADVVDSPDALPWDISQGEIEFHDVTFSYKPSKTTLKNISFKVPAGTTTAIVGDSGGGKTTIFNLLMRFYDVDSGKITIDGKDVREVTQFDLRKDISLVPQRSTIFGHTMKFNIGYGAATRDAEATEDKIIRAATLASIHDRIMAMPKGYDTALTSKQMSKLSGGESQRMTIARGLMSDGKIVLLDEATSALDMITEREVQAALTKELGSTTCLIIAHRL
ncbi:ATP-binding cassette-type vacuolar membrane transporter Hmt1, partial [Dispira parvispora]